MLVLCNPKIVGGWLKKQVTNNIEDRVRNESICADFMLVMIKSRMEGEIEQMWGEFKKLVVSSAVRVCVFVLSVLELERE